MCGTIPGIVELGICTSEANPLIMVDELGSAKLRNQLPHNHYDVITSWVAEGSLATLGMVLNDLMDSLRYGGRIYLTLVDAYAFRGTPTWEHSSSVGEKLQKLER